MGYDFALTKDGTPAPEKKKTAPAQTPELQRKADEVTKLIEQANSVYMRWQEATKNTQLLQADILKGVEAGADMTQLFLRAVLAISQATQNELFYRQIAETIQARTGVVMEKNILPADR